MGLQKLLFHSPVKDPLNIIYQYVYLIKAPLNFQSKSKFHDLPLNVPAWTAWKACSPLPSLTPPRELVTMASMTMSASLVSTRVVARKATTARKTRDVRVRAPSPPTIESDCTSIRHHRTVVHTLPRL